MTRQLSEFGEALLGYLEGGPMTTTELRSAEPTKWSRVYGEMMKLYRKGLVARLPGVNDRIEGHNSILWWRL